MSGKYSKTRSSPSFYKLTNPQCPKLISSSFKMDYTPKMTSFWMYIVNFSCFFVGWPFRQTNFFIFIHHNANFWLIDVSKLFLNELK